MEHLRDGRAPRLGVTVGGVAAAVLCLLWSAPVAVPLLALSMSLVVAGALAPGSGRARLGVVGSLPAGLLVLVSVALGWGLLGAHGVGGWAGRSDALLGLAVVAGVSLGVSARRAGRVDLWAGDWPALVGGTGLLLLGAWVVATQPISVWSRVTGGGTDFLRHLFLVREALGAGGLEFGGSAYPSGLHATGALLIASVASGTSAEQLWLAIAGLSWVLLCLMLVAMMAIARRIVDRLGTPGALGVLASVIAGGAFVQTAWFSTFLAFGSIMNMLVALALLSLVVTGLEERVYGSLPGSIVGASAMVATANGWQLLAPVAAAGTLVWFVQWWRRGRARATDWVVWSLGAALALNGALGVLDPGNRGVLGGPTVSDLFAPDWWWWAALALAAFLVVHAYRGGLRSWAATAGGLVLAGGALVGALILITGSTWDLMLYYPVKSLWTVLVVVIPLAAAGLVRVTALSYEWAGTRAALVRTAARTTVVAALALVVAGVLGRGAAFPPHLTQIAEGRTGMPNWSLAAVDALAGVDVPAEQQQGVLVFGIVPAGSVSMVTGGYVGAVDYMVMEALRFTEVGGDAYEAPVKGALSARDMTAVCRYLKDHPRSLRITGPNPHAGAQWIKDSGCPSEIVDSGTWVSLDIDTGWLTNSLWEAPSLQFPSVDEVKRATRSA